MCDYGYYYCEVFVVVLTLPSDLFACPDISLCFDVRFSCCKAVIRITMPRIPNSTRKNFQDSGIWIPLTWGELDTMREAKPKLSNQNHQ